VLESVYSIVGILITTMMTDVFSSVREFTSVFQSVCKCIRCKFVLHSLCRRDGVDGVLCVRESACAWQQRQHT